MRIAKSLLNIVGIAAIAWLAGMASSPPASAATTAGTGLDTPISITSSGGVATADNYTAYPLLNVGSVPPLVMLVMSRDEQLYIKAYTDYTDLDGDGVVDTTYQDRFDYSGYFDPNLCYQYSSGVFKASAAAVIGSGATKAHQCDGSSWSGNFLNWTAMSRIDVLRYVLYGGKRSTDTGDTTVLERSYIPSDLHAWAKVYKGSDVNKYTPYTSYPITMCNVSVDDSSNTFTDGTGPLLRVAKGAYPFWGSTAREQCVWREAMHSKFNPNNNQADINESDYASKTNDELAELYVRAQVCDPSTNAIRESFCRKYTQTNADGSTTDHWKPAGLLQRYGENGSMRFGLVTGSYSEPRTGGVLRRNIGLFAGNVAGTACAYNAASGKVDEVNLQTGQFCNQADGDQGIVNTLSRFRITSWNPNDDRYDINSDCSTYGILQRNVAGANGHLLDPDSASGTTAYPCKDSGNPLAEMYAEALRYIKGKAPTAAFNVSDSSILSGLPLANWLDPYRDPKDGGNAYCANCSIVLITTGLNSFDSDEIPNVEDLPLQANAATTAVGVNEDLSGVLSGSPRKYLVGRVGPLDSTTYQDVCQPRFISDLATTFGICPDTPSLEGGYQLAGLAYEAWTNNMRPDIAKANIKVQTYAIALAETLPTFQISVMASNSTTDLITVTPACQANNDGAAALNSSSGWRSCYLGNLTIGRQTSTTLSQSDWLLVTSGKTPLNPGVCGGSLNPCHVFGLPYAQDATGAVVSGSFVITWEDSQWGNDHDQDVVQMLTFCKGAQCGYDGNNDGIPDICEGTTSNACNAVGKNGLGDQFILTRTESLAAYAGNALQIGYTAAGAFNAGGTQDLSGVKFTVLRPGGTDGSLLFGKYGGATNWTAPSVEKYSSGPAEQLPLANPLFFAAKYGGFADQNGDNKPDRLDSPEWDSIINDTGAAGEDGIPDNYFLVRNPAQLSDRLARTFDAILKRSGSGTAAAVVANSANGVGTIYRAVYQAERTDSSGRKADWSGSLDSLWTDSFGRLREDANSNAALDGYDVDPVIEFYTDPNDSQTKFHRELMPPNADGSPVTVFDKTKATITDHVLDELKSIWSAQQQLWATDFATGVNSSDLTSSNRTYTSLSSSGRYVFTWIDANHNGVVDSGEQVPFTFTDGSSGAGFYGYVPNGNNKTPVGNYRFLNTASPAVAKRVVAWIRGAEVPDTDGQGAGLWRSRTVDYNNDGTLRVLRLGDIIDSTPVVVGAPSEAFDLLYGDTSYGKFRAQYSHRRQMVYVGANDGMLHAFNGGFYNAVNQQLLLAPTDGTAVTQDPLGSEIWAYVPGNLLPHLRWLADPAYKHNFYVDGSPIVQDVKIFATDADHPDGWGTVLIAPFRFGGGPIEVDTSTDSTKPAPQNSFSAYVVLDVTNPEKAPTVLAELTNTDLSTTGLKCGTTTAVPSCAAITNVIDTYTSSVPAAAIFRDSTSGSPNKFFLFTGSGTTDNGGVGSSEGGNAVSSVGLKIRAFDMSNWAAAPTSFDFTNIGDTNAGASSFAGDLIASDFNLDGRSEGLYFGSTKNTGSVSAFGGSLWKINFLDSSGTPDPDPANWHSQRMLSDLDLPVTIRPTLGRNDRGAPMVFLGTGRAYTKNDLASVQQQKILGLIDTSLLSSTDVQSHTLPLSVSTDLVDVTNISVQTDSSVTGGTDTSLNTFDKLLGSFDTATRLGWYLNLTAPATSADLTPSERVVSTQSLLGGILLTTTYFPGTDTCTDVGRGSLYGLDYKSGTASPSQSFFGTTTNANGTVSVNRSTDLGPGLPAPPSLHVGDGTGPRKITACVQTSTGAIICKDITTLKSVSSHEVSWREPIDK